jgi:chromosome segregation ATPase
MIFSVLTLVSALSISVIAAYFSIIGLATIFPGSIEAVIAMGAALEIGKIVAAIWLHKNWKTAPRMLKIYLFGAIVILMGITSMGIFGFLSKSHIEHEQHAEKAAALVTQVETKINREREYIARQKELIQQTEDKNQNRSDKSAENIDLEQKKIDQLTAQLEKDIELDSKMLAPIQARINQLNEELNAVQSKPGGLFSNKKKDIEDKIAEQANEREELAKKKKDIEDRISKYRNETSTLISDIRKRIQEYQNIGFDKPEDTEAKIEKYNSNIAAAQEKIDAFEVEKFDLDDGSRQLEAEVGPIKYVAELIADFTGMNFDIGKAVRIVIIILIFVFDPLAVLLVLAAHISLSKKFPKMVQDETIVFEKIAEIEAENKALEQQQINIQERKKDLEQERKILELNENQVKKYQNEISEHKETLRQLKLESQKELLKQEDTSSIIAEIEELNTQKESVEKEIQEIKLQKNKILSRAEETIQSAREIKAVLGDHNKHKQQIEELKSDICMNQAQFEKLKTQIHALESTNTELNSHNNISQTENAELQEKIQELETEIKEMNNKLEELEDLNEKLKQENIDLSSKQNPNLQEKIDTLIKQKNQLLESTLNKDLKLDNPIKITESLDSVTLSIPHQKSGEHCFSRLETFSTEDVKKYIKLCLHMELENPSQEPEAFNNLYKQNFHLVFDSRHNKDMRKKLFASYEFKN